MRNGTVSVWEEGILKVNIILSLFQLFFSAVSFEFYYNFAKNIPSSMGHNIKGLSAYTVGPLCRGTPRSNSTLNNSQHEWNK